MSTTAEKLHELAALTQACWGNGFEEGKREGSADLEAAVKDAAHHKNELRLEDERSEQLVRERDEALGGIIRTGRVKDEAVALLREANAVLKTYGFKGQPYHQILDFLEPSKEPQHD